MNTERIENSISEPTAIRGEDGFLICPLTQRKNEKAKSILKGQGSGSKRMNLRKSVRKDGKEI